MSSRTTHKKSHSNLPFVRIKVVGIGGAGGNTVSRLSEEGVRGVELVAVNTDVQDLEYCHARRKLYIGKNITKGVGTGMNPELGRQAAEESRSEISELVRETDLIFITAGFGGGTGTGAAPIIAEAAREAGALTIAVVTKPFAFEGSQRIKVAEEGLQRLREKVDTLIVIPNDRIFSIIDKDTPLTKAFERIDDVLKNAVQGVAEVITMPGIVNVDFADVRTIMQDAGSAIVGVGIASGPERSLKAVNQAINSPLLEASIDGAKGVLFSVSGGRDLTMTEINEAAKLITENIDPAAKVIFGAYHDRRLKAGQFKVILVATGFNGLGVTRGVQNEVSLFAALERPTVIASDRAIEEKQLLRTTEPSKVKKEEPKKEEKSSDIWDIPTFLRKKRK